MFKTLLTAALLALTSACTPAMAAESRPLPPTTMFEKSADRLMYTYANNVFADALTKFSYSCRFLEEGNGVAARRFCISDPLYGSGIRVAIREEDNRFVAASVIIDMGKAQSGAASSAIDALFVIYFALKPGMDSEEAVERAKMTRRRLLDGLTTKTRVAFSPTDASISARTLGDRLHVDLNAVNDPIR